MKYKKYDKKPFIKKQKYGKNGKYDPFDWNRLVGSTLAGRGGYLAQTKSHVTHLHQNVP
jgi:hypothetical protein